VRRTAKRIRSYRVPTYLSEIANCDIHEHRRAWIAALPQIIEALTEQWAIEVGEPYDPGGQCSWVAPARNASGDELVLKVGWRHSEATHEADAYRVWSGDGAVQLYADALFDQTSALLMERCVPGTWLGLSVPEAAQDVIVAGLLRRLWKQPPDGHPFRPLQMMCDEWAAEFEANLPKSPDTIDVGLAREGMALLRVLPQTADSAVLLCTDLHGENILAAQREPWLVIDPKPYVGDRAYDPVQHMLNCRDRLSTDPAAFARRMADLLDLDAERVRQWLFARCVQESIGQPELYEVAKRLAT
jgi:streptomycin 6-kinase